MFGVTLSLNSCPAFSVSVFGGLAQVADKCSTRSPQLLCCVTLRLCFACPNNFEHRIKEYHHTAALAKEYKPSGGQRSPARRKESSDAVLG